MLPEQRAKHPRVADLMGCAGGPSSIGLRASRASHLQPVGHTHIEYEARAASGRFPIAAPCVLPSSGNGTIAISHQPQAISSSSNTSSSMLVEAAAFRCRGRPSQRLLRRHRRHRRHRNVSRRSPPMLPLTASRTIASNYVSALRPLQMTSSAPTHGYAWGTSIAPDATSCSFFCPPFHAVSCAFPAQQRRSAVCRTGPSISRGLDACLCLVPVDKSYLPSFQHVRGFDL
ncbi:hypothetical protein TARUN_9036 [Trichoderma arundinaceum]|uniref:Uncharacterized protein n=1 Tax=Trichoderma arundinaceum TaxID=490622 RepID=A0A395NAT8_TRIAR|nr:hypothetical protein TARUN_9036 [Trichoderma arundinaceum]